MGMAYLLGSKCRFTAAMLNGLQCFLFFFVVDFSLSLYHRKCKTENLDNQTLTLCARTCPRIMATSQSEQQLMQSDSKFRNYASLMDKALRSFEYTNEWADLISALAKINKVKIRLWSSNRLRYMLFLISKLYLLNILLYIIVI